MRRGEGGAREEKTGREEEWRREDRTGGKRRGDVWYLCFCDSARSIEVTGRNVDGMVGCKRHGNSSTSNHLLMEPEVYVCVCVCCRPPLYSQHVCSSPLPPQAPEEGNVTRTTKSLCSCLLCVNISLVGESWLV